MTGVPGFAITTVETDVFDGRLGVAPLPLSEGHVATLATWGAGLLLTLVTPDSLARRNAAALPRWLAVKDIDWLHLPIADFAAPDYRFQLAWQDHGPDILGRLRRGDNVVVNCDFGFGRSGTIAARLLIDAGIGPDQAIAAVRFARPGAIESRAQVNYLRAAGER